MCVTFFNVPPGNKFAVKQNPLKKEESRRVYNSDDRRLSGSTKRWSFSVQLFKVGGMESLSSRVLHTVLLLCRHFHALRRDTERN